MAVQNLRIGIDLGGTNVRAGLIDEDGQILARHGEFLPQPKSPEKIVERMAAIVRELAHKRPKKSHLLGVGIGAPGGIDPEAGVVTQSPNLPLWKNVALAQWMTEACKLPVLVDNDANCFALGEQRFGGGTGAEHLLGVTLGTGIGGAMIINHRLWHGPTGMAGEFGHMVVEAEGLECDCGGRGCLEMYASGKALIRMAKDAIGKGRKSLIAKTENFDGRTVEEAARKGDELAKELFATLGTYLGRGIASLVNATGIPKVVVGGKVIRSWEYFYKQTKDVIQHQCFSRVAERVQIRPATLEDNGGILGAASLID